MPDDPAYTVVLTHFDCAHLAGRAIDSILAQSYEDWFLLVVDDHSPDPAAIAAVVARYPADRLLALRTSRTVGQFRIYNRLLPGIRSQWLAFQDADDWSEPDRLAVLAAALDGGAAEVVGSALAGEDERGRPLGDVRVPADVNGALRYRARGGVFFGATMACSTELARRLGGFDGSTRFGADTDFVYRAVFAAGVRNEMRTLYHYTARAGSLTRSPATGFGSRARRDYRRRIRRRFYRNRARAALGRLAPEHLLAPPNDVDFSLVPLR